MILVAYAHDNAGKSTLHLLKHAGFEAALVSSGTAALDLLRRHKPRLLLLNGTLDDVDGLELLRAVRSDPQLADLPVCLMSSDSRREEEAKPLGIAAFLCKPFFPEELFEVVGRFVVCKKP